MRNTFIAAGLLTLTALLATAGPVNSGVTCYTYQGYAELVRGWGTCRWSNYGVCADCHEYKDDKLYWCVADGYSCNPDGSKARRRPGTA